MKFYSTKNKNISAGFAEAVLKGMPDDGGLYMPDELPLLNKDFFSRIGSLSLSEIAYEVAVQLLRSELPEKQIEKIISNAITFDAPIVPLGGGKYVLELFHGPTLAFKDFGARFMAGTMSYLNRNSNQSTVILVATSGDTGSAVANGFYNVEGIKVVLLYPSAKVSRIQEQQLTTLGGNISALEVKGTFDDCQRLVKTAFMDKELNGRLKLSSANSINIARLIPQSFYYFNAYARLDDRTQPLVFSVPSGNFGNLTAGLFAKKMGLPVDKFIAATNANDVFTKFIESGIFTAKPSVKTLSNAMDVGNPSNFARIQALYGNSIDKIKNDIISYSFSDRDTIEGIKELYSESGYVTDPHGSVGYLALKKYQTENQKDKISGIFLETAHPAKFGDIVTEALQIEVEIPRRLAECMTKNKQAVLISDSYNDLKEFLSYNL